MNHDSTRVFLLVAGFPESILIFRGALIDALQHEGFQVHVAAPDLPVQSPIRARLERKGVVVHDIPLRRTGTNPCADVRTMMKLWALMRRIKPEMFLGYTIKPVVYGALAAWLARVPRRFALITGLGYVFRNPDGDRKHRLLRSLVGRLYALALRTTHKVFFQNPDDEAVFRRAGIIRERTPTYIVNGSGVDIQQFQPEPVPARPQFLLIARLLGDKGIREYARAAQRIRVAHPEVIFNLAGWIDDNPDAITQAELDQWSAGTLNYIGRLDDVRPAIAACSVYVLPSYHEGTPRTVLEAMATGRAIITSDAPGCRETVRNAYNGYLVPVKSVDKLTEAMLRFIDVPRLAQDMGARSREIAVDKYDVRKVNTTMLQQMGIKTGPSQAPA